MLLKASHATSSSFLNAKSIDNIKLAKPKRSPMNHVESNPPTLFQVKLCGYPWLSSGLCLHTLPCLGRRQIGSRYSLEQTALVIPNSFLINKLKQTRIGVLLYFDYNIISNSEFISWTPIQGFPTLTGKLVPNLH
jgi:hypothetical protein